MDNWQQEFIDQLHLQGIPVQVNGSSVTAGALQLCLVDPGNGQECTPDQVVLHKDLCLTRPKQVMTRVRSLAGFNSRRIHGRKTRVSEIPLTKAESFVNEHHLMGFGGGKVALGLFTGSELVAVGVFSRIRKMKFETPSYLSSELERFCSLPDTTLTGGLDKIIQHYFRHYPSDDLVTYIDKEWSSGNSFLQLGFKLVKETKPLRFAVHAEKLTRRILAVHEKVEENEYEIRNCGNYKLRLINPNSSMKG